MAKCKSTIKGDDKKEQLCCPLCEKGILKPYIKDLKFTYRGHKTTFKQEKVFSCNVCDFENLSKEDNKRIERALIVRRFAIDDSQPRGYNAKQNFHSS